MLLKCLTLCLLVFLALAKPSDNRLKEFVCHPPCPYKTTCQPFIYHGEIRRWCDVPKAKVEPFPDHADTNPEPGSNVGNDYH
uniref:Chitin-binding type-2 domain-containing protein n=1 Tax=Steinernema glaseri TaxID=37863 RepID=A0A1I7YM68_9BILA